MTSTLAWTVLAGFGLGLSLIVAIGAQNAFVLRQGLIQRHVLPVVVVCAASDAALILLGVSGMGTLIERAPLALSIVRWLGAAFLFGYAFLAARRALSPVSLTPGAVAGGSLSSVLTTCLALTWLNPHVYLDTVLLVGSVAGTHGPSGKWAFGLGAVAASVVWFTGLGFGARLLAGVFARPLAWRILDAAIAATMVIIAVRLLMS